MEHVLPDDGHPHAPTAECGCRPRLARWRGRDVLRHQKLGPVVPCAGCTARPAGYHLVATTER